MKIEIVHIKPIGKPRMTRRDVWAKRPVVLRYRAFKDVLKANYSHLSDVNALYMEFHLKMPKSWSKKKQVLKDGTPHDSKPDLDNIVKAVLDEIMLEDKYVWETHAKKFWSYEDYLLIKPATEVQTGF